jgi:hypothetical protein
MYVAEYFWNHVWLDLLTASTRSKWMEWTKLILLSKIFLHCQLHLNEWSEQSWWFCPRFVYTDGHVNHQLCSLHSFRRVRRCRHILDRQKHTLCCALHSFRRVRRCSQILDRIISFVHSIHSVQELSTPFDMSKWMKWTTQRMLLAVKYAYIVRHV